MHTSQTTFKPSFFSSLVGVNELLKTPAGVLGIDLQWKFQTPQQKELEEILKSLKEINFPELEKIAEVGSVDKVNQFLLDHGIDIQLDSVSPEAIAAAIYFKIMAKWRKPGKDSYVILDNDCFPGIDFIGQQIHRKDGYTFTVLELENGDSVIITLPSKEDEKRINQSTYLHQMGTSISGSYLAGDFDTLSEYGGLRMPKIDIRQEQDLSEILGLRDSSKGCFVITQALAEFVLQINQEGLKVEVAMAMAMEKGGVIDNTCYWQIDRDFCLFLLRQEEILFGAYLTKESWGEPEIEF